MAVGARRIKELFGAAIELPDAVARAEYLEKACGDDAELRGRLELLLQAHDAPASALKQPLAGQRTGDYQSRAAGFIPAEVAGTLIAGKYKLLQQIGEGGMGSVWKARQTEPVKRYVAVKLIKTGMDSKQVLARFEAERQALALMDHPNIARVLDAGATEKGAPYFVMELVKGVPITKYCDEQKLTPRQRLELFVPVCQAIQHAHQKGVIHRDIKPSNVMVALYDDKPVPKVIDFGVAKATGQSLTEQSLNTDFGGVVGTPEYMSPEQASLNNLDIDTRSDIYSLGVLLYELLAGSPPFKHRDLEKAGLLEMLRVIREDEPQRPSTKLSTADALPSLSASRGTEPKKLTGILRNELDWIVMKALEKDRARRYETANGFAADVNRFLAGEPVIAHPPSSGYRMKKFLRKNRGPVIAVSLVGLALIAGIIGTTWGLVQANRARADEVAQRQVAEAQKRKAEKAETKTLEAFRASTDDAIQELIGSKPELGPQEKAYLEKALARWKAFADREGDDERSRAIRAEGHFRVGGVWDKLGRREEAQAELRSARDVWTSLVQQFPAVPEYRHELASTRHNLGILLAELGHGEDAMLEIRSALDMQTTLVTQFPTVTEYQRLLARHRYNFAAILGHLGKREEARIALQSALDLQKKLAAQFPADPVYQHAVAYTHSNLGVLLVELGKRDEALVEYRLARDLQMRLVEQFPAVWAHQVDLAHTHNSLGIVFMELGKWAPARTEHEKAHGMRKKLAEQFPAMPSHQVMLGGSYCNFGNLIRNEGHAAQSVEWFDNAVQLLQQVHQKHPLEFRAKEYLRNSHHGRAQAFDRLQKYAEAVNDWDRTVEFSPPAEQPNFRAGRAMALLQAGRVAEAVAEVAELTKASSTTRQWYELACIYSVASGKIADKKQEYADRAMEFLHKSVTSGFNNAAHMTKDSDLDPLREREDFKKLIAELETKAAPPLAKP